MSPAWSIPPGVTWREATAFPGHLDMIPGAQELWTQGWVTPDGHYVANSALNGGCP